MNRRRNGHRPHGFNMDDVAVLAQMGDLVGDNSDEPRLSADDAVTMLTAATSAEQTYTILGLVKRRQRRRVLREAEIRRSQAARYNSPNGQNPNGQLPFGPGAA